MINLSSQRGRKIGIVGMGKTGMASAQALIECGAYVSIWDDDSGKREEAAVRGMKLLDLEAEPPEILLWSPGIAHYGDKAHQLARKAQALNIPLVCDVDIFSQSVKNDILGVTGTNGKSTTTALITHILKAFRPALSGGNIGEPVLTLPALSDDGVYVLELSSYQLELSPHLNAKGVVLLNITPDHLERHNGFENYVAAKEKIFAGIGNDKAVAIICIDSDIVKKIANRLIEEKNWTVIPVSTSVKPNSGVWVENSKLYDDGALIADLSLMKNLKGRHNHENVACAYALIRNVYGYEPQRIAEAMAGFEGLPHRQFLVRSINGISYVNDSKATNAEAVSHALACTRNVYWILGGQAKAGGLSGLENYMDRVRHAFLIGEAAESFAAWLKISNIPFTHSGTIESAVTAAHKMAQANRGQPGEPATVLLSPACASWDQFKSFEHRGQVFSDLVDQLAED